MTLLFVRHGESEGNLRRIMQGWLDLPLSDLGRRQAEVVARRVAASGATRLYASPLLRAWQTGECIAAATGLPLEAVAGFREYGYGEAQGLTWTEAVDRFGITTGDWGNGRVPGEEGASVFHARVTAAFDELSERHREDVGIVVAHGGTIARLVVHVLGAPMSAYLPFASIGNVSITAFAWDRDHAVLAGLNDACHLEELSGLPEAL
ncbi:MAG: histidine phosphatase family protein [Dehalococcoidia bacterium]|nr:histidine phosphatase family protein [Dehalococcoidia bacterium]